jgi:hypothetical protein
MQKNCKIFQLIVKKRQLPDTEEPEAGILEVCGKHLIDFHPLLGNVHVAFCNLIRLDIDGQKSGILKI